jgi:hypothetical protein
MKSGAGGAAAGPTQLAHNVDIPEYVDSGPEYLSGGYLLPPNRSLLWQVFWSR